MEPKRPIPPDERKKFKYDTPADQAEGERETVEESLRDKERKRGEK
jgi:hypothetical protein